MCLVRGKKSVYDIVMLFKRDKAVKFFKIRKIPFETEIKISKKFLEGIGNTLYRKYTDVTHCQFQLPS